MLSFPQSKSALFKSNPNRTAANNLSLKKVVNFPLPCWKKPTTYVVVMSATSPLFGIVLQPHLNFLILLAFTINFLF